MIALHHLGGALLAPLLVAQGFHPGPGVYRQWGAALAGRIRTGFGDIHE